MPDLSPEARNALRYWSVIEESAALRMTTQDLWNNLQDAAQEIGLASPGVTVQGVNELRALAVRIQAASGRLERIAEGASITDRLLSEAPWSRPQEQRNALGIFQVRFQHTTMTPEGPQTDWRTSVFRGALPATVAELRAAVTEDAQQLADKYGVDHIDLGSLQILAV